MRSARTRRMAGTTLITGLLVVLGTVVTASAAHANPEGKPCPQAEEGKSRYAAIPTTPFSEFICNEGQWTMTGTALPRADVLNGAACDEGAKAHEAQLRGARLWACSTDGHWKSARFTQADRDFHWMLGG
ncbi:hypothetical protein [Streptomyces microflavus]|uniref:Secreted protein n=1 Tax=Streptomyces microflavus TaxID=1919 RepID=A0A7H8MZJ0_STRMI|nr:hypothetical protein [Streptomyces microflavus]QKW47148.1 hypothetical protein HUT09_33970 [Streptomyces microflavus]